MDFTFPPETESWRSELRAFLKEELPPGFEGDDDFFDNEEQMTFARRPGNNGFPVTSRG